MSDTAAGNSWQRQDHSARRGIGNKKKKGGSGATGQQSTETRHTRNQQSRDQASGRSTKPTLSKDTQAKVDAIRESGSKYLEQQRKEELERDSNSDEEEESLEKRDKLLQTTLQKYYSSLSAASEEQKQLPEFFSGTFLASTSACLICLSSIRRHQQVWSCFQCYCLFHLQCIQRWVHDGTQRQSLLSAHLFPRQEIPWACPKCRQEYSQSQCPQRYHCCCGKVDNPVDDPWLLPHTCGEICDKPLQPLCGHHCVSLCHPGPCPPCPKTINVNCYCGRGSPIMKRCGSKGWSCGRICRKVLSCNQHLCEDRCHEGACSECRYTVQQPCRCGKKVEEKICAQLDWQCDKVCGNTLSCGHHLCEKICHEGDCGDCPRAGERKCPCSKTSHTLPCTKDVPTCGDTCGKLLSCGIHKCMRTCHYGNCGQCLQRVNKLCRCKRKTKEMTCGTEFLCESKCSNLRQCQRHPCRRKCCDGQCPPCEQTCGRTLVCGHHKCSAPCHTGDCYPCSLTITLSCTCGKTKRHVLCIKRRRVRPPICREQCSAPPKCHHPARLPHLCHSGQCPPCQIECGLVRSGCGHTCTLPCHSEPRQKPKETIPIDASIPWDKMKLILQQHEEDMKQLIVDSCPPCLVPVPQSCDGNHEIKLFPCSQKCPYTCHRICGRVLFCANHLCEKPCHVVINSLPPAAPASAEENKAGDNCMSCDLDCQRPRPPGCTHPCKLPCHPEACPACMASIKLRCHCSTMPIVLKCHVWTSADSEGKLELQACNNQCTKTLSCSHRCSYVCHAGPCVPVDRCTQKVTFRCSCKRLKKELKCNERDMRPVCDQECMRIQKEKEEENARKAAKEKEEEEKRKLAEREAFLKRIQGQPRKRKRKNTDDTSERKESFIARNKTKILFLLIAAILAAVWSAFQIFT